MSPKVKAAAAKEVKAKSAKTAPAKAAPKAAKASGSPKKADKEEMILSSEEMPSTEAVVDMEEVEEEAAVAASAGQNSNAAALAAASSSQEMSASFKNFRHHPDMENFYRFIYENDLRHEALAIIDQIQLEKATRKMVKSAKLSAH